VIRARCGLPQEEFVFFRIEGDPETRYLRSCHLLEELAQVARARRYIE